ncbi:MAG: oxaloacetate decarboxylase [Alphaproteobacteria bacterium]|nr:oxaloacetate decarboxylase [Alphaproteobacteria bacterium]
MASEVTKGARLRGLLEARRAVLAPGAANALTARLIADAGFETVYVTGAGIANTRLGLPDIGLVTLSELADTVTTIAEICDLPLVVDADTGFGNPLNMVRTVRTLERAGANAIQVEDQVFPKRCGHFSGQEVIPTGEMVAKVKAAVDTRTSRDFLIIARTDARSVQGLAAALDRAGAYIEAGADATFVEAPESRDELAQIARTLSVPQLANMVFGGRTPALSQAELAGLGFGLVLYANAALQAAVKAMQEVLSALKADGGLDRVGDRLASFAERQRVVNKPAWDALEKRYRT